MDAIKKLREIGERATGGDWEYERIEGAAMHMIGTDTEITVGIPNCGEPVIENANGEFIVTAKNTWKAICDALEAAEAMDAEDVSENLAGALARLAKAVEAVEGEA